MRHFVGQENLIFARLFGEVIEDIFNYMLENCKLGFLKHNVHLFCLKNRTSSPRS